MNHRKVIEIEVLYILSKLSSWPISAMHEETHLYNDLIFDSLDIAELAIELQRKFDVDIIDKNVKQLKQVKHIIDAIQHHQNSKAKQSQTDKQAAHS